MTKPLSPRAYVRRLAVRRSLRRRRNKPIPEPLTIEQIVALHRAMEEGLGDALADWRTWQLGPSEGGCQ